MPLKSGVALGALGAVMAAGAVAAPPASALTAAASGPSVRPAVAAAQARAGDTARDLRLDSREQLTVKDVVTDRDGSTHVRYQRTFAGLRVIGGDFVVHRTGAGAVTSVSWNASGKADVASTTPQVAAASRPRHRLEDRRAGEEVHRRRAAWSTPAGPPRGSRTTCS